MSQIAEMCIVVNRLSGGGKGAALLAELSRLKASGVFDGAVFELGETTEAELVAACEHYKIFIAAGGDGTVSYLASLLEGRSATLGVLPLGTANDLARFLGLDTVMQGRPLVDVLAELATLPSIPLCGWHCTINDCRSRSKFFLNYISFGWEGEVLRVFSQLRKKYSFVSRLFGACGNRLLYLVAGVSVFFKPALRDINVAELGAEPPLYMELSGRSIFFANIPMVLGVGRLSGRQSDVCSLDCYSVKSIIGYLRMIAGKYCDGLLLKPVFSGSRWKIGPLPAGVAVQVDGEEWIEEDVCTFTLAPGGTVSVIVRQGDRS